MLQAAPNAVEAFKQKTGAKLRDVRCPEHRQAPRLKFHGSTLRDVSIQMSGCCEKLIELANRAIAERGQASDVAEKVQKPLADARGSLSAPRV